mmetsp:Transcript_15541/g.20498  ORF Transcript_15541/g.20498 Transcript_15541/m.20498 type:complete len:505 (-) Transcript_15541:202-1716(-)
MRSEEGIFLLQCFTPDMKNQIFSYLYPQDIAQLQTSSTWMQVLAKQYIKTTLLQFYPELDFGHLNKSEVSRYVPHPKVSILIFLSRFGKLLQLQHENYHHIKKSAGQKDSINSGNDFISKQTRQMTVEWMIHMSIDYGLSPIVLHSSVHLLDECFKRLQIARIDPLLLGYICLMLESQQEVSTSSSQLDLLDVGDIFDLNIKQAESICRKILDAVCPIQTTRNAPTAFTFLCHFLRISSQHFTRPPTMMSERQLEDQEKNILLLSFFFADLSLADGGMLSFFPSTIAVSAIILSRLMTKYFCQIGSVNFSLSLPPPAVKNVIQQKRSLPNQNIRLPEKEESSLRHHHQIPLLNEGKESEQGESFLQQHHHHQIPLLDLDQGKGPLGSVIFLQFLQAVPCELQAVISCTTRLWHAYNDYLKLKSLSPMDNNYPDSTEFSTLQSPSFMLRSLDEKYSVPGQNIGSDVWKRHGSMPENDLMKALSSLTGEIDSGSFHTGLGHLKSSV